MGSLKVEGLGATSSIQLCLSLTDGETEAQLAPPFCSRHMGKQDCRGLPQGTHHDLLSRPACPACLPSH